MYTPLHRVLHSLGMHLIAATPDDLWPEPQPGDYLIPEIGSDVSAPLGNHDCLPARVLDIVTDESGEDWYHLEFQITYQGQPDTTTLWLPFSMIDGQ